MAAKTAKKDEDKGILDQTKEFVVRPVNVPILNISVEMWQLVLIVFAAYMLMKHKNVGAAATASVDTVQEGVNDVVENAKKLVTGLFGMVQKTINPSKAKIDTTTTPTESPVPRAAGAAGAAGATGATGANVQ